jgi:hypothetical protein
MDDETVLTSLEFSCYDFSVAKQAISLMNKLDIKFSFITEEKVVEMKFLIELEDINKEKLNTLLNEYLIKHEFYGIKFN